MTEIDDKCQLCDKPIEWEFKFLDGSVFRGERGGYNYLCEDCFKLAEKEKIVRYERIGTPYTKFKVGDRVMVAHDHGTIEKVSTGRPIIYHVRFENNSYATVVEEHLREELDELRVQEEKWRKYFE